ncbi:MAG: hypothetical protein A3K41_16355 [Chloroflexi bacterium RIFOXYD12_FULL_57_15]|nr:MAG: hypothetical protein A3K41_16355 [Chloroflexi bacterium RIFOXYD12_FULL_57_15]
MTPTDSSRGEMLLAIFKYKHSLTRLQDGGWYHIPVDRAPKSFKDTKWLCFYQGKIFEQDSYRAQFYGEIARRDIVPYRELFPNQMESKKGDAPYYRIYLKKLECLPKPILSLRPRRLSFVPTTPKKFHNAEQINDLFNDSELEDLLWEQLKKLDIKAERQWILPVQKVNYQLDFALFCNDGFIDVETDGDTYHIRKDRAARDNIRNNAMAKMGWKVLRFTTHQVQEEMQSYCIPEISDTIKRLGNLSDDGLVSRVFLKDGNKVVQQLSMFESPAEYKTSHAPKNKNLDSGAALNLEN